MNAEPPQVVIVAGGLGTRLASLHPSTPKALAPVCGRPFLALVLDLLAHQGVHRVHLCLGYRSNQVVDYLATRSGSQPLVTYSVEASPLGTAGALCAAGKQLEDQFVVLLGDTYTPVCFAGLAARGRRTGKEMAMVVLRNRDWLVPSNVAVRDGLVVAYDKHSLRGAAEYVDYGIALMRRDTLDRVAGAPADLGQLFGALIIERQLAAIETRQRFYEIGSPAGYHELVQLVGQDALPEPTAGGFRDR